MRNATVYLKHIRDAIVRIEKYAEDGRSAFFQNTMVQDSVIRNLEIIGEAVKNLPVEVKNNTRSSLAEHHRVMQRSDSRILRCRFVDCVGSCVQATPSLEAACLGDAFKGPAE